MTERGEHGEHNDHDQPAPREINHHRGVGGPSEHATVLHVGVVAFPQLPGPSDYYRLTFTGERRAQRAPAETALPAPDAPRVREQIGIDLPLHLGSTEHGLTGLTVEALLSVCLDSLSREFDTSMDAEVKANLCAALDGIEDALESCARRTAKRG